MALDGAPTDSARGLGARGLEECAADADVEADHGGRRRRYGCLWQEGVQEHRLIVIYVMCGSGDSLEEQQCNCFIVQVHEPRREGC